MKFKSLILGSAAGLLAMGGAQAADLPVKAKAVEYVRICSLYGAGFFYIPGTDTCIKLGGYLRVDILGNTNSDDAGNYSGAAGSGNRLRNYYTWRSREDLNIDTRTATEYGVLRTFFDATFSWTTTNANVAGTIGPTQNAGVAGSDTIGVYYAFIQFAGFSLGKAISQFSMPWTNYPANNFDGLVGGGGDVTGVNQVSYTWQFGNGVSATISAQDQVAYYTSNLWNVNAGANVLSGTWGTNNFGGASSPDLVGMVRVDQAWGLFQASVAFHDNHAGFYTADERNGHPTDKWGWAGQLGFSVNNVFGVAGDSINISGVYTNGASRYNFQDLTPVTYAIYGGTGLAGAYGSVGVAGVSDAVYSATAASAMELTTTYGFRGGYNHNWNPYWSSGLYGAWAGVRYNSTAQNYICTAIAAQLTAGSTCNPDFNVGQVGFITRWTPVKNLTFSGDLTFTHLDQKFAGSTAVPSTGAPTPSAGRPSASYEFRDQNTLLFLFRAQRNW